MSAAGGGGGGGDAPLGLTVKTVDRCAPRSPVIVTEVDAVTRVVVTANRALEEPNGTVTLEGTAATAGLLLERPTITQHAETAPLMAPSRLPRPPVTLVGLTATDESVGPDGGGFTLIVCVRDPVCRGRDDRPPALAAG